jgi:hypothetical protein
MFSLVREQVIAKEATFGIGRVRAATGRLWIAFVTGLE